MDFIFGILPFELAVLVGVFVGVSISKNMSFPRHHKSAVKGRYTSGFV